MASLHTLLQYPLYEVGQVFEFGFEPDSVSEQFIEDTDWPFLEGPYHPYYTFYTPPGAYTIELWGAEGGGPEGQYWGGSGAYVKIVFTQNGDLEDENMRKLFIYVGEHSVKPNSTSFNASLYPSTNGCYPGGGATDVRYIADPRWWARDSLSSRIAVAAGGGGAWHTYYEDLPYYMNDTPVSPYTGDTKSMRNYNAFGLNFVYNTPANSLENCLAPYGYFCGTDRCMPTLSQPAVNRLRSEEDILTRGDFGISSRINGTGGGGWWCGASSISGYPGTGGVSFAAGTYGAVKNIGEKGSMQQSYSTNIFTGYYSISQSSNYNGIHASFREPDGKLSTEKGYYGHKGHGHCRITVSKQTTTPHCVYMTVPKDLDFHTDADQDYTFNWDAEGNYIEPTS